MHKPKIILSVAAFLLVCLLSSTNSSAQTPPKQFEPSYEVVLQVISASNNASDKTSVPQTLSNVVKKLKTNYSFSNYRLASTYLQRVANTGNIEFKGVVNDSSQDVNTPVFSEFTLGQLLNLPDAKGQNSISIQNFRFGQRIPIKTSNNLVNYEQVGLTMFKINLPVNTPTVISNLSASKLDEMIFLVLTVKPVE